MANKITHQTREGGQQAILPFLDSLRDRVYHAVHRVPSGLTAEEVDAVTGIGLNNARSRCTEHFNAGRFAVLSKRPNKAGTRQIAVYSIHARQG
jgi:hypothetical protein